jgi:hypothetical protein
MVEETKRPPVPEALGQTYVEDISIWAEKAP